MRWVLLLVLQKLDMRVQLHPFGALAAMMTMDEYKDLRNDIGLDENSKVLLFSTEGDTDPDRYKNIVWKGLDK